jgi:hypothetical protein
MKAKYDRIMNNKNSYSQNIIDSDDSFSSVNNSSKSKQRMTKAKYKDELMNYFAEFEKQRHLVDKQLKTLNDEYEIIKKRFSELTEMNKEALDIVERRIKKQKSLSDSLTKDQRLYYMDILKKGIDVRHEGLCWVVKKIIELNNPLDYSNFPRYLDHSQIDYLLKVKLTINKIIIILN